MCQPGRPAPHGLGHDGSPGLAPFPPAPLTARAVPAVLQIFRVDGRPPRSRLCRLAGLALAATLAAAAVGCAGDDKHAGSALDYTENAKRDYELAMRALEEKNWEVVEQMFNDVRKNYSYSRYARLAELRIADANYEQDKIAEAISGYKSFVHDYPNDPEIPYARYKIAQGEYDSVSASVLAGEPIRARLTEAPAGGSIGGLKVTTDSGWFAARPSGTENVYKIYAESFQSRAQLDVIVAEAKAIVGRALASST